MVRYLLVFSRFLYVEVFALYLETCTEAVLHFHTVLLGKEETSVHAFGNAIVYRFFIHQLEFTAICEQYRIPVCH